MYQCKFCRYRTASVKLYISHYKLHSNLNNVLYPCGIDKCNKRFSGYAAFNCHLTREHQSERPRNCSAGSINTDYTRFKLKPKCDICQQSFNKIKPFQAHLRIHIKCNITTHCPYLECSSSFTSLSAFKTHLSRYHRIQSQAPITSIEANQERDNSLYQEDSVCNEEFEDGISESLDTQSLYNRNLALFYLNLQCKHHVPSSVLNVIISGIADIKDLDKTHLKEKIVTELSHSSFNTDARLLESLDKAFTADLFSQAHGENGVLKSDYLRNEFYKKEFNFVEPLSVLLGFDSRNVKRYCHYIPIKDTVKALFQDASVRNQYLKP
ncbi:hypothetical protein HOLleu_17167 [Holothuria leucospilota]|uniref:C2H2-type domain-containing protein n=1 Tax=Holothuria leucospilota TaxID=206669 RepID=A0A9Q1C6R6_HOLLE|nr:hypothetical protein HOLleu_17167 [Holothuria leucospilota]